MKAAELKAAADHMLKLWIETDMRRTEYSTRDYTASVLKEDRLIVVAYMRKETDEWPAQKVFNISTSPVKAR
jgi:hypothetical protein